MTLLMVPSPFFFTPSLIETEDEEVDELGSSQEDDLEDEKSADYR